MQDFLSIIKYYILILEVRVEWNNTNTAWKQKLINGRFFSRAHKSCGAYVHTLPVKQSTLHRQSLEA
jgi:hypothetical protein